MDLDSEIDFFLTSDSDVNASESEEENKTQTNKNKKKYLSVMEATKDIGIFDETNNEPTVFTEACERAYRRINPRDILNLNNVIRSKIQGKPREQLLHKEMNFHNLLLAIKRTFVPAYQIDWMYELINSKQELYETPMMFGKRLEKILQGAIRTYISQLAPVFAQNQIKTMHKNSLRIFLEKLSNERLREELSERKPRSIWEATDIAENIWNKLNFRLCRRLNENNYCPYCRDRDFHYFDCQIE